MPCLRRTLILMERNKRKCIFISGKGTHYPCTHNNWRTINNPHRSTVVLGACLLKRNASTCTEHPPCILQLSVEQPEKNYYVTELEALAIVRVLKHFYPYVADTSSTLIIDHAPLKSLLYRSYLVGRLIK